MVRCELDKFRFANTPAKLHDFTNAPRAQPSSALPSHTPPAPPSLGRQASASSLSQGSALEARPAPTSPKRATAVVGSPFFSSFASQFAYKKAKK